MVWSSQRFANGEWYLVLLNQGNWEFRRLDRPVLCTIRKGPTARRTGKVKHRDSFANTTNWRRLIPYRTLLSVGVLQLVLLVKIQVQLANGFLEPGTIF
jgi:hypothetical protein